jgi:hypothetical protein
MHITPELTLEDVDAVTRRVFTQDQAFNQIAEAQRETLRLNQFIDNLGQGLMVVSGLITGLFGGELGPQTSSPPKRPVMRPLTTINP